MSSSVDSLAADRGVAHGARAPRPRAQYLVTADEHSLAELELLLATLPLCSTGRVFIEVPDADVIVSLQAPPRMIVTWLDRSRRSGAPGSCRGCVSGDAVSRAAIAWADEMMCDSENTTQVILTGGFLGTAAIVDHLVEVRGVDAGAIRAPERFGLSTAR